MKKFINEIEDLIIKGGLNRRRGWLGMVYVVWYLIVDFTVYLGVVNSREMLPADAKIIYDKD